MGKLRKKKLNRKGFTLIELLAVIVILAILILLAMPSVLKVMENARRDAFATEVKTYLKAAEQKYVTSSMSNDGPITCVSRVGDADNNYKFNRGAKKNQPATSEEKLDIDEKTGYKYNIEIKEVNNVAQFTYTISNGTYVATNNDAAITEDVTVNKGNANTLKECGAPTS